MNSTNTNTFTEKTVRIAVIATNNLEDMEFIIPIDVWRRAKFIVDVIVCEMKNSFTLNYSALKVTAQLNLQHTNLIQYDAIFLPGGPGYKNYLSPSSTTKNDGESKLHLAIKKFYADPDKWLVGICASPVAIMCILDKLAAADEVKFTAYNDVELLGDFKTNWVDKRVMIDKNIITGQSAGCSFDLAFSVIEALSSLEHAKSVAESLQVEYKGYSSY